MLRTANSTLKSQNEIATFSTHEADLLPTGTSITTSLLSSDWADLSASMQVKEDFPLRQSMKVKFLS